MRNKVMIGALSALIVLGGAIAVTASKNDSQTIDLTPVTEGQKANGDTAAGSNTPAISVDEAEKIATNEVSGKVTKMEWEKEHGRLEYKFEIQSNRGEVDVRVDAETGEITRVKYDDDQDDDDRSAAAGSQPANTSAISVEEAEKIAKNEVNGKVTKIEQEMEHGRLEYKFEIQSDRGEVDVRVDAETGDITRVKYDD